MRRRAQKVTRGQKPWIQRKNWDQPTNTHPPTTRITKLGNVTLDSSASSCNFQVVQFEICVGLLIITSPLSTEIYIIHQQISLVKLRQGHISLLLQNGFTFFTDFGGGLLHRNMKQLCTGSYIWTCQTSNFRFSNPKK